MENKKRIKAANILRFSAGVFGTILGIIVFIFALLSGSEVEGGGLLGIIRNSPNALPWAVLLLLLWLAWKKELAGGLLLIGTGFYSLYFFVLSSSIFFIAPLIISLLIILVGLGFILSWGMRR